MVVSGIDLLLLFSKGHLKIVEKDEGISLAHSQELVDNLPNALEIAEQFLHHSDTFRFNLDGETQNADSGQTV